jgi:threonine synthase
MMGLPVKHLVVATNENNVLEEFFRTGSYRVRGSSETFETSSPSMDISKASNFERFVYDLLGRDGARTKALFADALNRDGVFTLGADEFARIASYGFQSGRSTHADRLATIRATWEGQGVLIDTHTADGVKVARELREPGVPMIVLETALPAKFEATIAEALGPDVHAPRPAALADLESRPKRFQVMPADTARIQQYIRDHVPL